MFSQTSVKELGSCSNRSLWTNAIKQSRSCSPWSRVEISRCKTSNFNKINKSYTCFRRDLMHTEIQKCKSQTMDHLLTQKPWRISPKTKILKWKNSTTTSIIQPSGNTNAVIENQSQKRSVSKREIETMD